MKTLLTYLKPKIFWTLWALMAVPILTSFSEATDALPLEPISGQTSFNQEVQQFSQFVQETFGTKIHFSKEWENNHPRFSADAMTLSGKVIRVSGYDFRSNTLGAFRLGLCHEVGHYLGGPPYLQIDPTSIDSTLNRVDLSVEGQADYFATYCLKKYFDYLPIQEWFFNRSQSDPVANFCNHQPKCVSIATAALELTNYLHRLSPNHNTQNDEQLSSSIAFDSYQDTQPSTRTLDQRREYPDLRCRLRTFLSGIFCENESLQWKQFACISGKGGRPDCWFAQPDALLKY